MLILDAIAGLISPICYSIADFVRNNLYYELLYVHNLELSESHMAFIIAICVAFIYIILSVFVMWLFYKVIIGFIRLFV